ncbi:MAG: radical SAM family heme chaperone HemW, partial [Pyrinomonadaceae bacterium]
IYLHIPFCKSRCSYCDFATDVYRDSGAVERYVDAICSEIKEFSPQMNADDADKKSSSDLLHMRSSAANFFSDIDTIYFGGGTPSLLRSEQLAQILDSINLKFDISDPAEITMEMNPATVTPETLGAYRSLGVNRASFGVQTFDDRDLKLLARGHDANDARQTFRMLREAGFENVSFDRIAGLPGQTLDNWSRNLDEAIALGPEHISLYLLEIHQSTPLAEQLRTARRPMPDEDLAAKMYELMLDRLAVAGYAQYEISNFSRPGFESRHNSKYWTLDPVFGFGVSAHSFDGHQRYANERDTAKYVELIESNKAAEVMREDTDIASEFVFLGLRLESGIDLAAYKQRFGIDLQTKYAEELNDMTVSGLVEIVNGNLLLSRKGKLFSNEVFAVFV